jgi:hypothetical protein
MVPSDGAPLWSTSIIGGSRSGSSSISDAIRTGGHPNAFEPRSAPAKSPSNNDPSSGGESVDSSVLPGDSRIQSEAETLIVHALSTQLGALLTKRSFDLPEAGRLEVDGASDDPPVLCEAWAHQGPIKAGGKTKVATDALKLLFAARQLSKRARLVLAFADQQAAMYFQGSSWLGQVIRGEGIEIFVVELSIDIRARIRRAQALQKQGLAPEQFQG